MEGASGRLECHARRTKFSEWEIAVQVFSYKDLHRGGYLSAIVSISLHGPRGIHSFELSRLMRRQVTSHDMEEGILTSHDGRVLVLTQRVYAQCPRVTALGVVVIVEGLWIRL